METGQHRDSVAIAAGPDPAQWAELKEEIASTARAWKAANRGKADPAFVLSESWLVRATSIQGIASSSIDYLGATVLELGRLTILNGLHFVKLEDDLADARRQTARIADNLAGSSVLQSLANRFAQRAKSS